jgi:UDP-glucose 4-epimerase
MIKKILITGSSGSIGTKLGEILLKSNYRIIGFDKKPNKWNPKVDGITIIGDLKNKEDIAKIPTEIDLIIHLAANSRVYDLVENPQLACDNFTILFNTLEFARKNNIKKFIFSSSREVYGDTIKESHKEDEAKIENLENPYASSKFAGEALIHSYKKCFNIDHVILRLSNVYGKYDEYNRIVPLFIKICINNKNITLFGKGKYLDFIYIDDLVDGIKSSIEKFDLIKNETINLGFGEKTSLLKVAELIKSHFNYDIKITVEENRTGEVMKFLADITKAKEKISYNPKINIEEGIKRSVEWYKKLYTGQLK